MMTMGEHMRGNPLPFLLVSAGVGLMIGRAWRNGADHGGHSLVGDNQSDASMRSSGIGKAKSESPRELREEAADVTQTMRSGLAGLAQEQPLVLGALGLLAGAALATMLPLSSFEAQHVAGAAGPLRNGATGGPSPQGHDTGEEGGVFGYQAGKGGARPSENVPFGQGSSGGYG
jgi:hypothetical protein